MNLFVSEIITPPEHLPVTVDADQEALARAVVDELEHLVLWRAIVSQTRRIRIDGPLPALLELEPIESIVSLTRWTPDNDAVVIDAAGYTFVKGDPSGTLISPLPWYDWPAPERPIGSFALTYRAGWTVTDTENKVPGSVLLMISKAIDFRAGSGLADIAIGSIKLGVADSYSTDQLPREIASIGRAYAYKPGLFSAVP